MKTKINKKVLLLVSFFAVMFTMIGVSNLKTSAPNIEQTLTEQLKTDNVHRTSPTRPTRPPEPKTEKKKSSFDKKSLQKIEKITDSKLKEMKFNGTFLIAVGDEIIYHKAMGYSDVKKKIPNTLDTRYEIGSCTKQFTAAAIAKLVQEKKLSLDDSLTQYIKGLKVSKDIKIRHLVNMCSGLPDYLNAYIYMLEAEERDVDSTLSEKELIEWVNDIGTIFKAGEMFSYSNTNYYFMGKIIEKVSGKSYENYIHDEILYPLYMDNSSMCMADTDSQGYLDTEWTKGIKVDSSYFYAAGEMVSTTSDMLKWLNAYNSGKVLGEDLFKKATNAGKDGYNYGYGWFVTDSYYYHTGNTELYYAVDIVTKKRGIKIIGLSNINDRTLQQTGLSLMTDIEKTLFPEDIPTQPPTEKPTQKPTEKPTEKPTSEPTDPPTEPPTDPPTEPPTDPPTEPPTDLSEEETDGEDMIDDEDTYIEEWWDY